MNNLDMLESAHLRDDIPDFRTGDTVKVHVRVVEGGRERVQIFEGVVIARNGDGTRASFTVRKVSFGVGVEHEGPVVGECRNATPGIGNAGEIDLGNGDALSLPAIGQDFAPGIDDG